ncbi:MAG: glycosyltransferase family 1 protein [Chloroflexia bacterium]|nr:glycosyltransferase family 1 protein [Chloroflexia bacterium]
MNYHIGFMMDQIAGHVTNYRNLRQVADSDPELKADWCEIFYYKQGGAIEQVREHLLPFVPTYFSGNLRASVDMGRGLKAREYDALFTNASVAVFFSRTFRHVPTLIDFDSTPIQIDAMEAYTTKRDPKPVEWLKYWLFRRMLHSATVLQAWSRWAKQSTVEDYGIPPEKIVINPPGINLRYWHPAPDQRGDTQRHPQRVLFVGGDFRRKGGEQLLEWYRTQDPTARELHIVTREPVASRRGLFIYDNMQPNSPELLRLYQQADLFVLPSLGECFGIATVEAMGAGLPVIASDVGGTADIIEPGRNGYIVPAGNIVELGRTISAILDDEPRRWAMGVQSRQLAEERFDLEVNARRTLGYLKQITQNARAMKLQAPAVSLQED